MTALERLARLAGSLDPAVLAQERWFGGKGNRVQEVVLVDGTVVDEGELAVVDVRFAGGAALERYSLPASRPLWGDLLAELVACGEVRGVLGGSFRFSGALSLPVPAGEEPIAADQSNTSVRVGDGLLVKCYRRLWPGPHPEVELIGYLGERVGSVPRALGAVTFVDREGAAFPLALVQELVPDAVDGWTWGRQLHETLAAGQEAKGWGASLGAVTAELHVALAAAPESRQAAAGDYAVWCDRARRGLSDALAVSKGRARELLACSATRIEEELEALGLSRAARLCRIHGDLHVGQVLFSPAGLFVVDFEGEPTRPPEERRRLDSPLRDVASMLRSFEHVPRWVLRDRPDALPAALGWEHEERGSFLHAYERGLAGSDVTLDPELLRALEVEKAVYELVYAVTFLPEWMPVAVGAMKALLA